MQNRPNYPRPPFRRPDNRPAGPPSPPGAHPQAPRGPRPTSGSNWRRDGQGQNPHQGRDDRRNHPPQGHPKSSGSPWQRDDRRNGPPRQGANQPHAPRRDFGPPSGNAWRRDDRRDHQSPPKSSGAPWQRDDRRNGPPRPDPDRGPAPRRDFRTPAGVEWRSDDHAPEQPHIAPPRHDGQAAPPEPWQGKPPAGKYSWKPGNMLYPAPVVLVGSGSRPEEYNVMTVAWAGNICTDPPLCAIALKPTRHSFGLIQQYREFTINLTTRDMVRVVDWCGIKSGSEVDKFKETGLEWLKPQVVRAPLIAASPVNIECRVKDIQPLGSHHLIIGEVVALHASREFLDERTRYFNLAKAGLLCYAHGKYYIMGQEIGKFGFSVQKRRAH